MNPEAKNSHNQGEDRAEMFARLWGVAMVAHVVGNWAQPDLPASVSLANLGVGLTGLVLAIRPTWPAFRVGAVLVVASLLLEMPFTGNHWFVAGLVSVAALATWRPDDRFFASARLVLLVFYGFAAFAKLNSAFLDPTVSCAVFYTNQSLDGVGLPILDPSSRGALLPVWGSLLIELGVPVLLAFRGSRYFGVLLATAFHILISYDLNQHFFDFTSVLIPLLFLFAPDATVGNIAAATRRWPLRTRKLVIALFAFVGAALVLIASLPINQLTMSILTTLPFALWVPFSIGWLGLLWTGRKAGEALLWRPGLAGLMVAGLTFVNGFTPYLELKTAYGFNMYSNLITAQGRTNHLIVPRTFALRDGYDAPVEILESSDPALAAYGQLGYLIALPQLRRYLAQHPEVSITYIRSGEIRELAQARQDPALTDPGPWWWRFMPLRALDSQDPPRCQDVFLAAT